MRLQRIFTISSILAIFFGIVLGCKIGKFDDDPPSGRSTPSTQRDNGGDRTRNDGGGQKQAPKQQGLIGKWRNTDATVEFTDNRNLTINGVRYNYSVSGSTMTLIGNDGQVDMPFELNGDNLTVTYQGRPVHYTRMGGNDMADNSGSGGGSTPQELVGKWCYLSNVNNSDGGKISSRCVVLNADGSYQYSSETDSSNPYGGTSSQSSDSGRWTATSTSLTAHSNSGQTKTYTLEKRNHPKNGDPMLIIDGDAYASFFQKQPW